jgi:hypothetical protein
VPEASSWPGEPTRPAGAPDLRASAYGTLQLELKMRGGTLALLGTPGLSVDASDLAIKHTGIDLGAPAGPIDLAVRLSGSTRYGEIRVRRTTGR